MGKKLAIKGHPTRGKEVIELFKMMGGWECGYCGNGIGFYYYISQFGNIEASCKPSKFDTYIVYTLEEFLEKYPFKVNDKVVDEADGCPGVVCEMKWDEDVSDMKYCVAFGNGIDFGWFANDSINYFKIKKNENLEETQSKREYDELRMPLDDDDKLATEATIMGKKILPPDGYLVGKITQTDNGMLVEYVEKKPVYPKTYKECCDVLLIPPYYNLRYHTYEPNYDEYATSNTLLSLKDKLNILGKLIICRDTYWKIAGEEMGLGKPWEPKYEALMDNTFFTIQTFNGEIDKSATSHRNSILAFPTIEMRDTFYENFKDLIEQCKELL